MWGGWGFDSFKLAVLQARMRSGRETGAFRLKRDC